MDNPATAVSPAIAVPNRIRLLILEDRPEDAELIVRELRRAKFDPDWKRVDNEADFSASLQPDLDVILADHSMPQFDSARALHLLQQRGWPIPFIVISGALGEEHVVHAMQQGAADYLTKDRLVRLGPAITLALEKKRLREDKRRVEATTRAILDNAADGIITTDERGAIESFNPAAAQIFGYPATEVIGQNIRLLIPRPYLLEHESYRPPSVQPDKLNVLSRGREVKGRRKDSQVFPLELAVSEVRLEAKRLFVAVVRDITERKAAEDELTRSREQLRALAARLEFIREEERTRIAREVHDVLGQALTSLKMDLCWINMKMPPGADWLEDRTVMMSDLIDSTIQTVRKIATELRPPVLDNLGLGPAIEWQLGEFQARTGIECRSLLLAKDPALTPDCATALFRIFQETLTNVVRHAQAALVEVSLSEEAGQLVLTVKDNGRGISPGELQNTRSLGLLGMKERAIMFGGQVIITGAPGQGTTVKVTVPLAGISTGKDVPID